MYKGRVHCYTQIHYFNILQERLPPKTEQGVCPFLATISRVIQLESATELFNTKVALIVAALLAVVDIYLARGFKILSIAADYIFEVIRHNEDFMKRGFI